MGLQMKVNEKILILLGLSVIILLLSICFFPNTLSNLALLNLSLTLMLFYILYSNILHFPNYLQIVHKFHSYLERIPKHKFYLLLICLGSFLPRFMLHYPVPVGYDTWHQYFPITISLAKMDYLEMVTTLFLRERKEVSQIVYYHEPLLPLIFAFLYKLGMPLFLIISLFMSFVATLSIVIFFLLLKRIIGEKEAFVAAFLIALSPLQMYIFCDLFKNVFALLFMFLSFYLYICTQIEANFRNYIALILVLSLLLASHILTYLITIGTFAILTMLKSFRNHDRKLKIKVLMIPIIGSIIFSMAPFWIYPEVLQHYGINLSREGVLIRRSEGYAKLDELLRSILWTSPVICLGLLELTENPKLSDKNILFLSLLITSIVGATASLVIFHSIVMLRRWLWFAEYPFATFTSLLIASRGEDKYVSSAILIFASILLNLLLWFSWPKYLPSSLSPLEVSQAIPSGYWYNLKFF